MAIEGMKKDAWEKEGFFMYNGIIYEKENKEYNRFLPQDEDENN